MNRNERSCLDEIIPAICHQFLDCLTGARELLHFIEDEQRLAFVKSLAKDIRENKLDPDSITYDDIAARFYTGGMPDPDLIIRTGGEFRLSNFLLCQSAYSEFYSTEILWPDFHEEQFDEAIRVFNQRNRRFGGV